MAISVLPELDPRIIVVPAPDTEITAQELVDQLRDWEDDSENAEWPFIISAAGKEALGGGVVVGITATLQNAQLYFEARSTPRSEDESCTTGDTKGEVVICSAATFQTDGAVRGDAVRNETTGALATIVSVDSETQLTTLPLTGGSRQDYQVSDLITVYNNEQCEVSGGNVVAVDENQVEIPAILPSPYTQVVRTSASSATLSNQLALEHSSFNQRVYINTGTGAAGTAFPIGTGMVPSNNLTDALLIANERGFHDVEIQGSYTFSVSDDISGLTIEGEGRDTLLTFPAGVTMTNSVFEFCILSGTISGNAILKEAGIVSGATFDGVTMFDTGLLGTFTLSNDSVTFLVNGYTRDSDAAAPPVFVCGTNVELSASSWRGDVEIRSATAGCTIDLTIDGGGIVTIDASCTGGNFTVRGDARVVDNSGGAVTLDVSGITPNLVWDAPKDNHVVAASMGERFQLIEWITRNKMITDPTTGVLTIYDSDGTTVLATAQLYEDAAGTQTYRGLGSERRERIL